MSDSSRKPEAVQADIDSAMAQVDQINEQMSRMSERLEEAKLRVALLSCPYKVGDRLRTSSGIGVNGLLVTRVTFSENFSGRNRWAIDTVAFSIKGEVTKRTLRVTEFLVTSEIIKITVEKS